MDRLAIKRLAASDCTLFEAYFKLNNTSKQKGVNLNADVLIRQMYPGLRVTAEATDNQIALAVSIYGPGAKGAHELARKIVRSAGSKNWRLNGEFIPGPPDDLTRYDGVQPGDLAIMGFTGEASPSKLDLVLIGQAFAPDALLYAALLPLFGQKTMIVVTPAEIASAALRVALPANHPAYIVAADPELEVALEDAAQGGTERIVKLLKNRGGRTVSSSDLARAKAKAESTGLDGEELVNDYLTRSLALGQLASFDWSSSKNAVSPFDFETISTTGQRTLIDAKSTAGKFENPIHLSLSEIIEASGEAPYVIFRVFEIDDDGAKLRISSDIRAFAQKLKTIHETHMPQGIRVDGFSVSTGALEWEAELYIERSEEI